MKKTIIALGLAALMLLAAIGCTSTPQAQPSEPSKTEETSVNNTEQTAETPAEPASAENAVVLEYDVSTGDSTDKTTLTFDPATKTVHVSAIAASMYACEADLPYSIENGTLVIPQTEATATMVEEAQKSNLAALFPKELTAWIWTEVNGSTLQMWFGAPDGADEPRDFGKFELTPEILASLSAE